jgi:hypothetical protein
MIEAGLKDVYTALSSFPPWSHKFAASKELQDEEALKAIISLAGAFRDLYDIESDDLSATPLSQEQYLLHLWQHLEQLLTCKAAALIVRGRYGSYAMSIQGGSATPVSQCFTQ